MVKCYRVVVAEIGIHRMRFFEEIQDVGGKDKGDVPLSELFTIIFTWYWSIVNIRRGEPSKSAIGGCPIILVIFFKQLL